MTFTVSRHVILTIKPLTVAIALAAAFPSLTFAQPSRDTTLSPVVVTASRTPQKVGDVLADTTVITSGEIATSGHTSLIDLLQNKRGIEITRNGGPGTNSTVYFRGAEGKQSVVLIDGVRIGSSTSGEASWQNISLSQIERVEIVYGPLSTLYGANAVGGVLQIFTRKGDGAPRFSTSAGLGSYGTRTFDVGVSGSTGGDVNFRYSLGAARESSKGFSAKKPGFVSFDPDMDGYTRESANGQFSLDFSNGHELGLIFLQSRLDSQFDNSAPAIGGGRRYFDDRNEARLGSYALFSRNRFLPNWTSQVQLAQSKDKLNSTAGTASRTGTNYRIQTSRFDTTQNSISWQNDVTFGTDLLQFLVERREESVDSTSSAVARERTTNSAALSYQLRRDAHLASASVRSDRSEQFGTQSTGSLAYGYRLAPELRVSASIANSFRAPTFNELYATIGTTPFGVATNRPEKGKSAEIGVFYDDGKSQLSAAYYRSRITDLLTNFTVCPIQPTVYTSGCAYNVNQALLTGLTLGAGTKVGKHFALRGSLDLQDPRDETADRQLQRRAKRHALLAVEYAPGALRVGAETVLSSERFEYSGATTVFRMPGYGLLNLYSSYDLNKNWSVFGRWNNVLDKDYEVARNYATSGSNLFVGIRYGFR